MNRIGVEFLPGGKSNGRNGVPTTPSFAAKVEGATRKGRGLPRSSFVLQVIDHRKTETAIFESSAASRKHRSSPSFESIH